MSQQKRVRTALIGCGNRGVNAVGKLAKASNTLELVAVCDVDEARARAASEQLGVPAETDHRRLLERHPLDSVLVVTSAKWHVPVALDAVRAGKHIYVEKPLSDSAASGSELARAADGAGVVGIVGYQRRLSPFCLAMKEQAATVQPVQGLITRNRGPFREQFFFGDFYGGVMDHATHDIHFGLWLMGGEPTGVYATVVRGLIRGDNTIEFANLVIDFEDGKRSLSVVATMHGLQTPNVVQVVGRKGTVTSTDAKTLRVVRHGGITAPLPAQPEGLEATTLETGGEGGDATDKLLDHFAGLITGREREYRGATLWEGTHAVAVMEAAVQSAQTGQRVELKELLSQ